MTPFPNMIRLSSAMLRFGFLSMETNLKLAAVAQRSAESMNPFLATKRRTEADVLPVEIPASVVAAKSRGATGAAAAAVTTKPKAVSSAPAKPRPSTRKPRRSPAKPAVMPSREPKD